MSKKEKFPGDEDAIIIKLWPKTPILYPMAFLALICGIVGQIYGVPDELKGPKIEESATLFPDSTTQPASETNEVQPEVIPNVEQPSTPAPAPTNEAADAPVEENPMVLDDVDVDKSKAGLVNTILALVFLGAFAFSLFVVCIDFEVRWSLLIFVVMLLVIMGLYMADRLGQIQLPSAMDVLDEFTLYATPLFYYAVFAIWVLLMIVSAAIARLHFVRIEHNEVIVHGGLMESQKRMSTFRMHWTKEIQDVFEYWLPFVRSGTLIFTFPNEEKPLILNNVIGINRVLKKLDNKSSSFQVKGASGDQI